MSDVIARMRLESQDFDSKLKSATANLQHMEREVRRTGATFEYADKEELAFLQSLGQMETKALDAKGKIKELSNSYKELAMMYERMTDAEKASKPGQALAASLQQLKTRLNDTKQSFEKVQNQIGEGSGGLGGALEKLGSKIGIPSGAFTTLGGAIAAGAAAVKIAGDAFKQNEVLMDEWGRTTEAAQSVYQGFLNALNTGDFSGFFSRIDDIVAAAKSAYDAMDELGTFTAFNQRNVAKSRAGYAQALDEYRLNPTAANKDALASANEQVKNDLKASHDMTENAYQQSLRSIAETKLSSKDLQDAFVKAFSEGNYTDLTEAKASYSKGKGLDMSSYYNGQRVYNGRITDDKGNWRDMTEAEKKQFEFARALSQVTDEQIQKIQALGAQAVQIEEQIYQQDRAYNRLAGNNAPLKSTTTKTEEKAPEGSIKAMREQLSGLQKDWELATDDDSRKVLKDQIDEVSAALDKMIGKTKEAKPALQIEGPSGYSQEGISALRSEIQGGMKGMQIGSDEYMFQAERLVDLTAFENLLKTATANGIQPDPALLESLFETIDNAEFGVKPSVPDEAWDELVNDIDEQLASKELPTIELDVKTGGVKEAQKDVGKLADNVQGAIGVFGQLGGAMQQIDDPGAKVAGIIMEAVANVAGAFAKSLMGTFDPWEFMAASIAGVSTMISTIATIKSVTSGGSAGNFASGGIVPGNSYSGDNMIAHVNSGETILSVAQANNVADALQGSATGNIQVDGRISGKDIVFAISNYQREKGVTGSHIQTH